MTDTETPARARFAALLERSEIPLDEAALAIAAEEYPDLDTQATLARLDALADEVGAQVGDLRPPLRVLQAMRGVLREHGFRGNEKEYYDPRNSFLNEVMERKLGIPISLSILTVEVARRLGVHLQGVGFPGHFLVKCAVQPGLPSEIFVDAFNGWELLGSEECTARFRSVLHGRAFDQTLLDPVDSRHILTRLLHNLKRIYVEQGDDVRAYWVIDRLLLLHPDAIDEVRDRGLVEARLGLKPAAARDLEAYLEQAPGAADVGEVRELLESIRAHPALLN